MAEEPKANPLVVAEAPVPDKTISAEQLAEEKRLFDLETTIHNEKTKLTAGAVNTTAVGIFGGGFILPLVALSYPLSSAPPQGQVTFVAMIVWAVVGLGLHWWSRTMLGQLK